MGLSSFHQYLDIRYVVSTKKNMSDFSRYKKQNDKDNVLF